MDSHFFCRCNHEESSLKGSQAFVTCFLNSSHLTQLAMNGASRFLENLCCAWTCPWVKSCLEHSEGYRFLLLVVWKSNSWFGQMTEGRWCRIKQINTRVPSSCWRSAPHFPCSQAFLLQLPLTLWTVVLSSGKGVPDQQNMAFAGDSITRSVL